MFVTLTTRELFVATRWLTNTRCERGARERKIYAVLSCANAPPPLHLPPRDRSDHTFFFFSFLSQHERGTPALVGAAPCLPQPSVPIVPVLYRTHTHPHAHKRDCSPPLVFISSLTRLPSLPLLSLSLLSPVLSSRRFLPAANTHILLFLCPFTTRPLENLPSLTTTKRRLPKRTPRRPHDDAMPRRQTHASHHDERTGARHASTPPPHHRPRRS